MYIVASFIRRFVRSFVGSGAPKIGLERDRIVARQEAELDRARRRSCMNVNERTELMKRRSAARDALDAKSRML